MYYVTGGVHETMDFIAVKNKDYVSFGPFETYQKAYDCWKEHSWLNVDNALYRLTIGELTLAPCEASYDDVSIRDSSWYDELDDYWRNV